MSVTPSGKTLRELGPLLSSIGALALGLVAQFALLKGQMLVAGVFYLVAVATIVYAMRHPPERLAPPYDAKASGFGSRWGWMMAVLAGLCAVLALWQFDRDQPLMWAWVLYLASLVLFWVSTLLWDRGAGQAEKKLAWSRVERGALVVIFLVAAFMRLYRFVEFPFGTYYDEADNGLNAQRILEESDYRPVYVESTNLPAHYLYLIAGAFRLLGVSTQSMRLVSVTVGMATVAAAYLTGRELFNRPMGLVLAFLLAVSRWDINWSRIAMHGVTTPLFELLAVGLLLRALRRGRLADFALTGLAVGIGLCFYVPFRVFPVVMVLFLAHQALVERGFLRRSWRGLIVLALVALLAVAPVAQFALRHPDTFWERTRWVSVSADSAPGQVGQAVIESIVKHLLMFNYQGDPNPRHNLPGEPMLDPLSGVLMVLGLGVCLARGRQPRSLLLPMWLGIMLLGGVFSRSVESPHSLRSIGSLPAAYLLAVVPLDGTSREWMRLLNQRYAVYGMLLVLALLAGIGYANYNTYFERQAKNAESWSAFSTGETITARLMVELGDSVEYYVPWDYVTSLTIPFIAGDQVKYQLLDSADDLPLRQPVDKDVVLIMDAERRGLYRDARRYYPQATLRKWDPPFGGPTVLYMVRLTPADVASGMSASP